MAFESFQAPAGYSFEYLPVCPSTNDLAFQKGPGSIVCAGRQTAARGRMGRSYSAEEGGLWFSLCVQPPCALKEATALPALAALAVRDAIGGAAKIKWPNDILLDDKKVCGILTEARGELIVFGIGINLQNELPEDLPQAGRIDRKAEELLSAVCRRLAEIVAGYPENRESLMQDYAFQCCTLGRMVDITYRNMPMSGFACSVDKHGGLMVMTQESRTVVTIYSGEATFSAPAAD